MTHAITILGTGLMGSAFAQVLLSEGFAVTAWNRTLSKAEPLREFGASIAPTVADAVKDADVIFSIVRDYESSHSLYSHDDVSKVIRGKTLIELTSGAPDDARSAAEALAMHGVNYLDGAILATPDLIGTDNAAIIVSGNSEEYNKVEPILSRLGSPSLVGDDAGTANALDVANLSMMWGSLFGAIHSISVCQAEGIDPKTLNHFIDSSLPVIQLMSTDLVTRASEGRYAQDAETLATVETHAHALHHLVTVMEQRGLDQSVVAGYQKLFGKAESAGQMGADFSAMVNFMKTSDE